MSIPAAAGSDGPMHSGPPPQKPAAVTVDDLVIRASAPDGGWFVAGDPNGSSSTLFSRTPALPQAEWNAAHRAVEQLGVWPCLMLISPTDGGADKAPAVLCTYAR